MSPCWCCTSSHQSTTCHTITNEFTIIAHDRILSGILYSVTALPLLPLLPLLPQVRHAGDHRLRDRHDHGHPAVHTVPVPGHAHHAAPHAHLSAGTLLAGAGRDVQNWTLFMFCSYSRSCPESDGSCSRACMTAPCSAESAESAESSMRDPDFLCDLGCTYAASTGHTTVHQLSPLLP